MVIRVIHPRFGRGIVRDAYTFKTDVYCEVAFEGYDYLIVVTLKRLRGVSNG